MKIVWSVVSVVSLFGAAAFLPIYGGVVFAVVVFGLFLLALVGVIGQSEDRTVRQHDPVMDARVWRKRS